MYINGIGFRRIERVTRVHHITVIRWVKLVGEQLADLLDREEIHEVGYSSLCVNSL